MMRLRACLCCMLLAFTACSNSDSNPPQDTGHSPRILGFVSDTATDTAEGVWGTVEAPFEDVGIKEDPIPDKLQKIVENPYALPNPLRCDLLQQEIAELDALLGTDVCTIGNPTGAGSTDYWQEGAQQGGNMARDKATGFVGGKISLPFRGLVRKISGADKHAKAVERAYQNGKLRRAFLRGIGMSLMPGCLPAQAPPSRA